MASNKNGRFVDRLTRALGAGSGRRANDPRGAARPPEEDPLQTEDEAYTVDDHGEPTIERRVNRASVGGRLLYPVVRVAAGPDLGGFVPLAMQDEILVGRDPKANLQLSDPGVSRLHARIAWRADNRFVIKDLGSTNGIEIDGEIVTEAICESGTRVGIANVTLALELLETPQIDHLRRVEARLQAAEGRDPLTGLFSRLFLDDKLPELVAEARRTGCFLCCLFLDLDHFKNVNDSFGHQVGDEVLRQAAHLAVRSCRQDDFWVRYGGEELVAFMPGTDEETAWVIAERVRMAVLTYDWSRTHADLQLTVSIGLSRLRPGEPVESWLGRADQALYLAKRNGRNRTERSD